MTDGKSEPKLGVWVIGALGSVSTCMILGTEAIRAGSARPIGLVSESPPFRGLGLACLREIVFGGHDVRSGDLVVSAREIARRARSLDGALIDEHEEALRETSEEIRTGTALNCGSQIGRLAEGAATERRAPLEIVDRIVGEIDAFRSRHRLERVVVLNLASTEPYPAQPLDVLEEPDSLEASLAERSSPIPASVIYAYAAIRAGCPYINFTPSAGSSVPALIRLAQDRGVPHMGRDGKTGETLLKSTLAPMFAARHLEVLSWVGYNILGNRDGEVLSHGENREAKIRDKDEALRRILGHDDLHSSVRIDYVPSLDDWKTAWDFVHFEGFLGTRMSLQFTWQGADSMLAAPLCLDLVRFADLAARRGEGGLMPHLAGFFKSPTGVDEPSFARQHEMLLAYARRVRAGTSVETPPAV